jgi:hypothetical protein
MKKQDYPQWVCSTCGNKYGHGYPEGHVCTMHYGLCGVCGKEAVVTEPRDYGHLKDGWQNHKKESA